MNESEYAGTSRTGLLLAILQKDAELKSARDEINRLVGLLDLSAERSRAVREDLAISKPRRAFTASLADTLCPSCVKPFKLEWRGSPGEPITLDIDVEYANTVHEVKIRCPHCGYEEVI